MAYKIAKITRPVNGEGDANVTLTATIKKGSVTATKLFQMKVKEQGMSDTQCVAADKAALEIAGADTIKGNIMLPAMGANGTLITWASGTPAVVSNTGVVVRPANGQSEAEVILTATIKKGTVTDTKPITVKVLPWTDGEEVDLAYEALTWETIRGTNASDQLIASGLVLSAAGARETSIVWTSTNTGVIAADGAVTRPSYTDGDTVVSLTATITKGSASKTKQFLNLKVTRMSQTNAEAVDLALSSVTETTIKGTNASLLQVTDNLVLPKTVAIGIDATSVSFSWAQVKQGTSNPSACLVISDAGSNMVGVVSRPASGSANESVTLTLTATSTLASGASSTKTKTFSITILKNV